MQAQHIHSARNSAKKVDFLVVGTPKGGTTALSRFLAQHPDLFIPEREVPFFSRDELFCKGNSILESYYKDAGELKIWGGVDVTLLYFLHTAKRIYDYRPDMKLIAVLRNPVDRAYSAYWYARRFGWESSESFEEALGREEERGRGSLREQAMRYLPHGHYSRHISYYMDVFGKANLKVVLNDDLKETPQRTIKNALEWLGVDPDIYETDVRRQINEGGLPRFEGFQKGLSAIRTGVWPVLSKVIPPRLADLLFVKIKRPLVLLNTRKGVRYPPLKPETREMLVAYFRTWNAELGSLLGRDLSRWDR